jgi:MFS transporter, PHS family, inorganic phosphate transporter
MGKIGSIFGLGAIAPLRTRGAVPGGNANPWLNHVLEIYSLFMLLGIGTTALIPETKRNTLEELAGEDDYAAGKGRASGANGSGIGGEGEGENTRGREVVGNGECA